MYAWTDVQPWVKLAHLKPGVPGIGSGFTMTDQAKMITEDELTSVTNLLIKINQMAKYLKTVQLLNLL